MSARSQHTRLEELLLDRALGVLLPEEATELASLDASPDPDDYELAAGALRLALDDGARPQDPASLRHRLERHAQGILGLNPE